MPPRAVSKLNIHSTLFGRNIVDIADNEDNGDDDDEVRWDFYDFMIFGF